MITFESVWALCQENNRAIPRDWNGLYQRLKNKRHKPTGGWEPSLPLILTAWETTMPFEKVLRFREHIEWAEKQDQLEEIHNYLIGLSEDEWFHFGELPN